MARVVRGRKRRRRVVRVEAMERRDFIFYGCWVGEME